MKTNNPLRATGAAAFALALAFAISACGKKDAPPPASSSAPAPSQAKAASAASAAPATAATTGSPLWRIDNARPGRQLGELARYIVDSYNSFKESHDAMGLGVVSLMNGCTLPGEYDAINRDSTDEKKGKLRYSDMPDAVRTKKGDEIHCSVDYTHGPDARGMTQPGDRFVHKAVFNLKTHTLVSEVQKIRDGQPYEREVYEVLLVPDGTIHVQSFSVNASPAYTRSTGKPKAEAAFFRINADKREFLCVQGPMKNAAVDFTYDAISAAGPDELAARHIAAPKTLNIKDGKIETGN